MREFPHTIDLHMHSTVSDGTETPAELLEHVRRAGLSLFSLTDHDAIRGCGLIREALKESGDAGLHFINGVEFSCKDERGKYHILGYDYAPEAPSIVDLVKKGHGLRMKKVRARLDFLEEKFGFAFSQEDLDALLSSDNPGKPHIANLMVKYGYADTRDRAIKEFINQKRFRSEYVRPDEAIRGILDAGGIPILAHPAYGSGDQIIVGDELCQRVAYLKAFGLQGLEAYYSGFPDKIRDELLAIAQREDLLLSAGSDYHGANKLVKLGQTGLAEAPAVAEGLWRFLERTSVWNSISSAE